MRIILIGCLSGLVTGLLVQRGTVPLAWLAVLLAGCVAVNLLCLALFPRIVERIRGRLEAQPLRAFLSGLLALLMAVWLVSNLTPPLRGLVGLGLGLLGLALLVAGMPAATAAWMGQRLVPEQPSRRQLIVGTSVWGASLVVPVVGWLLAVGLAVSGLGASLLSLRSA